MGNYKIELKSWEGGSEGHGMGAVFVVDSGVARQSPRRHRVHRIVCALGVCAILLLCVAYVTGSIDGAGAFWAVAPTFICLSGLTARFLFTSHHNWFIMCMKL